MYFDKPIIFYQFDKAEYEAKQGKLYIDVEKEGIGRFVSTHNELIDSMIGFIKNKGAKFIYKNKGKFFFTIDKNNTKRVVDAIESTIDM
jgi:CDP-glycerol glycerophosphotransferase (TagB/SpsB family)